MENCLSITDLEFSNFRSYERLELSGIGPLTLFVGANGMGKSNILEGIELLSACTSFRHPKTSELVRQGSSCARIALSCSDGARRLDIALSIEENRRRYTLNGKRKSTVDLKGTLPAVTFTPDDLEIAKGASGVKRDAIDNLGSQLSHNYAALLRDFSKVLRYKNRLLKDEAADELVRGFNDSLITCSAQLTCYRMSLFFRLVECMRSYYREISGGRESFDAAYVPSLDKGGRAYSVGDEVPSPRTARDALSERIEARFADERAAHRSLVGAQSDKVIFTLDGKDVSSFASQGQQRSVVLAFKLAEAALIERTLKVKPLLLLDDVMSELDASRRHALVSFVSKSAQTFITATTTDYFDGELLEGARIIELPLSKQGERAVV